jgi:hypothetical protein
VGDLSKVATDTIKDTSKTATDALNKAKGIGDIFQKK